MAETVTCAACGKKYAMKPELAGKRAKCKCGGKIQFPSVAGALTEGPAAMQVIPLEAKDDKPQKGKSAIFEPLNVAPSAYDLAGDSKPAPAPPASGAKANACANCKKPMTPGAVICMACGFNQKTGSAVRTQVFAAPTPAAAPRTSATTSTSGGGGISSRSGMMNMAIGGGLVVLGLAVTIGTYNSARSSGGSYYVFYGPVVFGAWRFIKGLGQAMSGE